MVKKPSSTVAGFLGSLILLIGALVVFFVVLGPWSGKPAVNAPGDLSNAAGATAALSKRPVEGIHIQTPTRDPASDPATNLAAATKARVTKTHADGSAAGGDDPDVQKAINLIDAGNIQEALALLEAVLKRDPNNEQALVESAMVHLLDLKQPEQALGFLQRVMEIDPQNQIVMSEMVSLYEEQGKVDEGINFLTGLSAKSPGHPELAYGIGQLLTLQGRDADAVPFLEKAAQSPDNQMRAYRDLGEAYARSGDSEKAIDAFNKSIAAQEKEIADKQVRGLPVQFAEERLAYTKLSNVDVLLQSGKTEEAQALLDEVKVIMPTDEKVTALQNTLNRKRAG